MSRMRRVGLCAAALCCSLALAASATAGSGSFTTSDPLLNRVYTASVATAEDMVSDPVNLYPAGCYVPARGKIILDGVDRDRCVYTGDLSVTGQTLLLAGVAANVVRNMILLFAGYQRDDGAIPPSACLCGDPLIDYSGYWLITLYDYVLDSGDLDTLHRVWPNVRGVLDRWYPSLVDGGTQLVANVYGPRADYALLDRHSAFVAYYNAQYVYVLRLASTMARWLDALPATPPAGRQRPTRSPGGYWPRSGIRPPERSRTRSTARSCTARTTTPLRSWRASGPATSESRR